MTEFKEKYINPNTEIAKFSKEEYKDYEDSLKHYRDLKNSLDTSKEEGRIEGRIEEKKEIAKRMLNKGLNISFISEITGLTAEEVSELK